MSVQASSVEDRLLKLQLRLAQLEKQESCRENFLDFVNKCALVLSSKYKHESCSSLTELGSLFKKSIF